MNQDQQAAATGPVALGCRVMSSLANRQEAGATARTDDVCEWLWSTADGQERAVPSGLMMVDDGWTHLEASTDWSDWSWVMIVDRGWYWW